MKRVTIIGLLLVCGHLASSMKLETTQKHPSKAKGDPESLIKEDENKEEGDMAVAESRIDNGEDMVMAASYHKPKKKGSSHKSYGGSSGYKGYKGKKSGKKGKSHTSKHFDKKGAQKKGHNDSKKYYGDMKKGNKGHKAAKYGKKGHHHKGHNTKGFKNTYHKNEYSKKTKFYDSYDNGGYHKKYGGYKGYYGGNKGSKYKGGKDKAGYYGDKHGKKGYDSKGSHNDAHKGEKGHYGHKGDYGSKASKGGGGGYGHDDHHGGYGRSLPVTSPAQHYGRTFPEATTTKWTYNQPPMTSNNDYNDAHEYNDDYGEEDFGDYDGYNYALEQEQKAKQPPPRYNYDMPKPRTFEPPLQEESTPEYEDYSSSTEIGQYGSSTEEPNYYVPAEPHDDHDEPMQNSRNRYTRPRPQKPKNVKYYQDLSDPKDNTKGYARGFYKSWDSKEKDKDMRGQPPRTRSRGRPNYSEKAMPVRYTTAHEPMTKQDTGGRMSSDEDYADSDDSYSYYHPFSGSYANSDGPSLFARSFALADVPELSPRGGFYEIDQPEHHSIQKRGGSMSYGGVYPIGPDGNFRNSEGADDYNYDDYNYAEDDNNEGRSNYLQGYEYSNDYPAGHHQGGRGYQNSRDYQDFQRYEPYHYYADLHARGVEDAYAGYDQRNHDHPEYHQQF